MNVSEHNKTDETKREHGRPDDDSWLQPERLMEVQCASLKKGIEDKEVSINFLKKQVERTDRSRYDICEVFSPLGFVSLRGIMDLEEAGLWTSALVIPAPGDATT